MSKSKFVLENIKGLSPELLTKKTMLFKEKFIQEAIEKKVGKYDVNLIDYKDVTRVEIKDNTEKVFFEDEPLITFYPLNLAQKGIFFDISGSYEIH